ncbi:glutaredoxin GrxC family [Clostridium sp. CAG:448]|nr:glutaredoxin GrxC family [Clostridium sp. CAG:448]
MNLVDDVDTVSECGRRVNDRIPNGTDIVHAVIGSGVHFHHIGCGPVQDGTACRAHAARISVLRMLAVDRT